MSRATYSRITNVVIACGIVAVLMYDHSGRYAWVVMGVALASGVVAAASYFILNWNSESEECSAGQYIWKNDVRETDKPEAERPYTAVYGEDVHRVVTAYEAASELTVIFEGNAMRIVRTGDRHHVWPVDRHHVRAVDRHHGGSRLKQPESRSALRPAY